MQMFQYLSVYINTVEAMYGISSRGPEMVAVAHATRLFPYCVITSVLVGQFPAGVSRSQGRSHLVLLLFGSPLEV